LEEQKRAEESLRDSEERYRLLVDLSPDGICMYTKGRDVFANKSMATILGLQRPEELIGKQHLDLIHPEYRELVKERMAAELTHDMPVPMVEEKVIRYDGTVVDVEVAAAPISYRGQPAGLAVIRDITARKEAEEKREQLLVELQNALAEVKKLSGFLPICASCKKIRDDKGYWQQIERYISDHSEALFSHSICPDCARKLYPDLFTDDSTPDKGVPK
jgi:PAS domain S-box-containing protein